MHRIQGGIPWGFLIGSFYNPETRKHLEARGCDVEPGSTVHRVYGNVY